MSTAADFGALDRAGKAIRVNDTACGAATVFDTNKVNISGAPGEQRLVFNLDGGDGEDGLQGEPTSLASWRQ